MSKVQAIQQWPIPQSTRALRNFLGLVEFYRRFVHGYASIAAPLTRLTTTDPFEWSSNAQHAFSKLNKALTIALILLLLDFTLPFTLEIDASGVSIQFCLKKAILSPSSTNRSTPNYFKLPLMSENCLQLWPL